MSLSRLIAARKNEVLIISTRDFGKFLLPMPKDAKMKNVAKMLWNMLKGGLGFKHKTQEELVAARRAKELAKKLKKANKEPSKLQGWVMQKWGIFEARFNGIPIEGEKHSPDPLLTTVYGTTFGKTYKPPAFPEMLKDYKEHPERDLVNFPYPVASPFPPKHRLTVFPESWFKALEPVTGESGGYLLAFGVLSFLIGKEFLIWPMAGLPQTWFVWFAIVLYLLRHRIQKEVYTKGMDYFTKHKRIISDDLQAVENFKKLQKARLDALMATKDEFPRILQDNLNGRFEHYNIHNGDLLRKELKRHLDFLKESELEKQRLERSLFVNSIIKGVQKQIDTNQDGIKEKYLDYCIQQLNALASRPNPLGLPNQ